MIQWFDYRVDRIGIGARDMLDFLRTLSKLWADRLVMKNGGRVLNNYLSLWFTKTSESQRLCNDEVNEKTSKNDAEISSIRERCRGQSLMGRQWTVWACALSVILGSCVSSVSDETFTDDASTDRDEISDWTVQPVSIPDLSQLPESVKEQIRNRFSVLETKMLQPELSSAELARAHGDVGLILMAAGFYSDAEIGLRNAQVLVQNELRWPYYLGQLFLLSGDGEKATIQFENALVLRPADLPTVLNLGEMYLDQARLDDAERLYQQACEIEPQAAAAWGGLGRTALAQNNQKSASEFFEKALALEPAATRFHYPLALAYRGLGEEEKAEMHLLKRGNGDARPFDPLMQDYYWLLESAEAHYQRGILAMDAEEWRAAADIFRRGLALDPESATLQHALGLALYWMGDADGALTQFQELLQQEPGHVETHVSLGVLFAERELFSEALARFATAAKHDTSRVDAHLGQAEMLRNLGRLPESIQHWRRVVELDPTDLESWLQGANALLQIERYSEARDWLIEAREIHSEHQGLREMLAFVHGTLGGTCDARP